MVLLPEWWMEEEPSALGGFGLRRFPHERENVPPVGDVFDLHPASLSASKAVGKALAGVREDSFSVPRLVRAGKTFPKRERVESRSRPGLAEGG
jgi:hypothetical protein